MDKPFDPTHPLSIARCVACAAVFDPELTRWPDEHVLTICSQCDTPQVVSVGGWEQHRQLGTSPLRRLDLDSPKHLAKGEAWSKFEAEVLRDRLQEEASTEIWRHELRDRSGEIDLTDREEETPE